MSARTHWSGHVGHAVRLIKVDEGKPGEWLALECTTCNLFLDTPYGAEEEDMDDVCGEECEMWDDPEPGEAVQVCHLCGRARLT